MPKLTNDRQLNQLLQRYFTCGLRNKLIEANGANLAKQAHTFTQELIASDDNVNEQIQLVTSAILAAGLPKATFTYLINHLEKIAVLPLMIDAIFPEVNTLFTNDDNPHLTYKLTDADAARIRDEISRYLQQAYGETDMREYATHERNVRRMDSLARILSLSSRLSVCSAVTFYHGKLLIAANLGKENDRDKVINALKNRFEILCQFIAKMKDAKVSEMTQVVDTFYNELISEGGSNLQKELMVQAMCKFAHAIYKDSETFTDDFRDVFTGFDESRYLIILPATSLSGEPALKITNYVDLSQNYVLTEQPACKNISLLHAEQLIAWYIFEINAESQETLDLFKEEAINLPLGITKLSCKTCQHNLSALPFDIRGTHHQSYPDVLGLFTRSAEPRDPEQQLKAAVTFAERSNPGTIFDSQSSVTSLAKKTFSFGSTNSSSNATLQPCAESCSRAASSKSHSFFSSAHASKEKDLVVALSKPGSRGAPASISDYAVDSLQSKQNRS